MGVIAHLADKFAVISKGAIRTKVRDQFLKLLVGLDYFRQAAVDQWQVRARTAFIRRGPWGYLWAEDPRVRQLADWSISSLAELPALIRAVNEAR